MERQLVGHVWRDSAAAATLRPRWGRRLCPTPRRGQRADPPGDPRSGRQKKIAEKTGLIERRFLWPLDIEVRASAGTG